MRTGGGFPFRTRILSTDASAREELRWKYEVAVATDTRPRKIIVQFSYISGPPVYHCHLLAIKCISISSYACPQVMERRAP